MATHLRLDGISFAYPARPDHPVLRDVSLVVPPGARVGLIGENGAGKSTALAVAAGVIRADAGTVTRPARTGLLTQQLLAPPDSTVGDILESAMAPVRFLEAEVTRLAGLLAGAGRTDDGSLAEAFDLALRRAENSDVWSLDARVAGVAAALHLPGRLRLVAELSGGQRRRLALAALLVERPDALLLDEPTNHLDDDAMDFLAAELRSFPGPVLMASHDRWFLDAVATGLVDLDPNHSADGPVGDLVQGRVYTGGYSDYVAAREAERHRWQEALDAQEAERERLEHIARVGGREVFHTSVPKTEQRGAAKFYSDKAARTVSGRVRQARRGLQALDRRRIPPPPRPLVFRGFPAASGRGAGPAGGLLVQLDEVSVDQRLSPVSLRIDPGDRVLVEGDNGVGKSTLLGVLAGSVEPDAGQMLHRPFRVGMLTQEEDWADITVTADAAYRSRLRHPELAPSLPELGLVDGAAARTALGRLSPGQRRRVAVAVLVAEPPDLLLLDEPTNHLSLSLTEELEAAWARFPGALVVASHDRWTRQRWNWRRIELAAH